MKLCYSIIVITCFFTAAVTAQTTVAISAASDNTIYQIPNGNSNALGQNIFSGTNGGSSPRRGLIKFDVAAAVPAGAAITSVSLTLNCNVTRVVADDVSLHKLLSNWGEGSSNAGSTGDGAGAAATTNDATWFNTFYPASFWTNPGGDFTASASATTSITGTGFFSWNTIDMVADVQTWLNNPAANYGWILLCNETTLGTARRFASRENSTAANRPSLSITYTTTLPVLLTYFKARATNNGVLLNWETAQEINNRFFEILYSPDGSIFSPIGKIQGHGTSTTKNEYQFKHNINIPGNHFYKLAQVDFDGNQQYSTIEKVYIHAISDIITLSPNPVLNDFTISSSVDLQNTSYRITDITGALVQNGLVGSNALKAGGLKAGIYFLCLYKNEKIIGSVNFVKR